MAIIVLCYFCMAGGKEKKKCIYCHDAVDPLTYTDEREIRICFSCWTID